MDGVRHAVHTVFKNAAEKVLPTRSESGFKKHGVNPVLFTVPSCATVMLNVRRCRCRYTWVQVLTPEEFVTSGEYLVKTCSTWTWCVALDGSVLSHADNYQGSDQYRHIRLDVPVLHREAGDPARAKEWLPKDKQYLVTRKGKSSFAPDAGHCE